MNVKRACDNSPEGADESWVSLAWLVSAVAVPDETDSLPRPISGTAVAVDFELVVIPVSSLSSDVWVGLLEVFVTVAEVVSSSESSESEPLVIAFVAKPVVISNEFNLSHCFHSPIRRSSASKTA